MVIFQTHSRFFHIGRRRAQLAVLSLLSFLWCWCAPALAGTWQWTTLPNGEALTFTADAPLQGVQVTRTAAQGLSITGLNAADFSPAGAVGASTLVHGVAPLSAQSGAATGLGVDLKTPAFGYLVLRPTPQSVVIRVYYDPLGARWQPSGALAPATAAKAYATPPAQATGAGTPAAQAPVTHVNGGTPQPTQPAQPAQLGTPVPQQTAPVQAAPVQATQPQPTQPQPMPVQAMPPQSASTQAAPSQGVPTPTPTVSPLSPSSPAVTTPAHVTPQQNLPAQATPQSVPAAPQTMQGQPASLPPQPVQTTPRPQGVQADPRTLPVQSVPVGQPTQPAQQLPTQHFPAQQPMQQRPTQQQPTQPQPAQQFPAQQFPAQQFPSQQAPQGVMPQPPVPQLPTQGTAPAWPTQNDLPSSAQTLTPAPAPLFMAPTPPPVSPLPPADQGTPQTRSSGPQSAAPDTPNATAADPFTAVEQRDLPERSANDTVAEQPPLDTSSDNSLNLLQLIAPSAHAATTPAAGPALTPEELAAASTPAPNRNTKRSPQEVRAAVNTGGPESWPENQGLSTSLSDAAAPQGATTPNDTPEQAPAVQQPAQPQQAQQPAGQPQTAQQVQQQAQTPQPQEQQSPAPIEPQQAAQAQPVQGQAAQGQTQGGAQEGAQGAAQPAPDHTAVRGEMSATSAPEGAEGNATRPVIYVDETGKEVPKPPEPDKMLAEAERLMEESQNTEALALLNEIKALTIPPAMLEKVLYLISDATEALYAGKPAEGLDPIVNATSEAMNANLRSSRVPDALFRLGMAYLRVDNILEAEGYFKALRRRFPHEMNVPEALAQLGVAQFNKKLYPQAEQNLRIVMQEYPESSVLKAAAMALVKTLYAEGKYQEAAVIADFVDKRWPRQYLNEPGYLRLAADLSLALGKLEQALQQMWLYYNIDPNRPDNDEVLANIGDIYLRTNRVKPAMEIFSEVLRRYPGSLMAAQAWQRLAERGLYDSPITVDSIEKMFAENATNKPSPPEAYAAIKHDWPECDRARLSALKMAIWKLYNKQYTDAMGAAADFIDTYPDSPDVDQAREVIVRAFRADLKNALAEENYGRILLLWNGFPLVRERYGPMDDVMRNALARGYLERGDENKAMELFSEFLKTPKHPLYSDPTFALYFNKYLQEGNWNGLLDLGELVKNWDMTPEMRRQIDYAMALASENLGLAPKALELWHKLAAAPEVPLYQRAYAYYFLARDAEQRKDIRDAYTYNKTTLELFTQLEQERSDKSDPARIKRAIGSLMDITEVANRIPEALEWVERYNNFVPEDSPEYPGLRFREARLYRKLGNTAKARAILEHIVQKAPDSPFGKAAAMELRTFDVSRDLQNFMPTSQQQ